MDVYQPLIDNERGNFNGVEVLLRWENKELGKISPAEFIPLAEETGLIIHIGEWVLRKACYQTKAWCDQGIPLARVAVNVSAGQLLHNGFASMVNSILAETMLDPGILELERSGLAHSASRISGNLAQSKSVKFAAKKEREYEKDEKESRSGIQSQGGNSCDQG